MSASRCFVCGAGPRGLRAYSSNNRSGKWVTTESVCAEWLVPCHRRNNTFGRKARRGLPTGERGRRNAQQRMHRERVANRAVARREEAELEENRR